MTVPATGEPGRTGLSLDHEWGRSVRVHHDGVQLLRYVYRPWDAQVESPRPYLHPLRTLGGALVSLYRPHDHVWHKGIAWSLPNVGTENFWGGPTYVRGKDYQHLENNGTIRHEELTDLRCSTEEMHLAQSLTWWTQSGAHWLTEERTIDVQVLGSGAWLLLHRNRMTNVSGQVLPFGSPTTEGRPDAGYGGLFWRGPRSFSGGTVHTPDATGKDELNGVRAPWLAFTGRHDGAGGASTVVFAEDPGNDNADQQHTQWFVRSDVYAVVSPSPFYSTVRELEQEQAFTFGYAVVVADGAREREECAQLAETARHLLTKDRR